jgi:hypothetical protein
MWPYFEGQQQQQLHFEIVKKHWWGNKMKYGWMKYFSEKGNTHSIHYFVRNWKRVYELH